MTAGSSVLPLRGGGGGGVHGKLPHGALLQVLLLPLGDVRLQCQNPLLTLSELLLQAGPVQQLVRRASTLGLGLLGEGEEGR